MAITLRNTKGSALTHSELDGNFTDLDGRVLDSDGIRTLVDSNYVQLRMSAHYSGFDSDFGTKSTTNLTEGSNLYYTTARHDSDFGVKLDSSTTDNLSEGTTNLYYTTARGDSDTQVLVDSSYVQARQSSTTPSVTIQDEGVSLATAATTLNFVGAGVTASGTDVTKTITISGGSGSGLDSAAVVSIANSTHINALAGDSDVDFGTNKILYSNNYANTGDLPNATTYHGMFAHVHAEGRGYFAHGGNWVGIANQSEVDAGLLGDTTPELGGNLDVNGNTIEYRFNLTASGSDHYVFNDSGNNWFDVAGENDPTLYLRRGETYVFNNTVSGSHPFRIQDSANGSQYDTGVTNNANSSGNLVTFTPRMTAPSTLYYRCTLHSSMAGTINIV